MNIGSFISGLASVSADLELLYYDTSAQEIAENPRVYQLAVKAIHEEVKRLQAEFPEIGALACKAEREKPEPEDAAVIISDFVAQLEDRNLGSAEDIREMARDSAERLKFFLRKPGPEPDE